MRTHNDDGTAVVRAPGDPAKYAGVIAVGAILALVAIRVLLEHK